MDRTTDPALGPVRVLVEEHLALETSSWSAGAPGALARLTRTPGERAQRGPNSVVTARGGLRVVLPDDAIAVAYETPSSRDPMRWLHAVAFCVPDEDARCAGRRVVTELGPDSEALRPPDLSGTLFDLGLGAVAADVLVRTADPEAVEVLRAAVGRDAVSGGLLAQLTGAAPDVVVVTAAGRMEITAPGGGTGLRLRPAHVRQDPGPAAHLPVPDGWTSVLRLHPAHPAAEPDGQPVPFDPERDAAFRALLAEHGDPVLGVVAADVVDAVRAMRGPETMDLPGDPASRAAIAVTLRRLAFTDGTSGTLAAWRGHYGPTVELADPDE
ncbi:DUF6925 family protein [Pseudonocardia abyssalis]|uniref:Uncharacterized protein n=1 Tax=Pseudonocardia abyssalis TaxID=2792008 RepID=A0ABS6UKA3_9PSEU|nr:hypothetical protein [Pseudonocardia abyssalis]MBW0116012.1 hypothetical protein [Pseudonocardia abyssalis]MBW0132654.1 hypothetical protein [Pseudonocardia abyssalis]